MLETEKRNPKTTHIDQMATADMLRVMNEENMNAVRAVEAAGERIAQAIDAISERLKRGGRLFYIGAGTSGRLGVVDAAECPPTFGVSPELVVGIIAGGRDSMFRASEGVEDSDAQGRRDILAQELTENDTVMGISAAGGAAYVLGALDEAEQKGCLTVGLSCNAEAPLLKKAQIAIYTPTGPEVITGSTRLKAGTAQKLVLNMISTCVMVKTGKVLENLMINLRPSNIKLRRRMIGIVCELTGKNEAEAEAALDAADWNIRRAVENA